MLPLPSRRLEFPSDEREEEEENMERRLICIGDSEQNIFILDCVSFKFCLMIESTGFYDLMPA